MKKYCGRITDKKYKRGNFFWRVLWNMYSKKLRDVPILDIHVSKSVFVLFRKNFMCAYKVVIYASHQTAMTVIGQARRCRHRP